MRSEGLAWNGSREIIIIIIIIITIIYHNYHYYYYYYLCELYDQSPSRWIAF